ncbi:transcription antitermination factor NusB [Gulosibacter macacae]|uniref:Transcription antitermination protein NusB n=1 Tax=Gulosibacter macacae TaxID=2488791 RepID=A0A3P3VWV9_9MICO|nr:transcription antitermination factor NusB [Gulosibacter macacae]RRJ87291.1 transcription antitermination factor NusB [Gulosibacter macacae]
MSARTKARKRALDMLYAAELIDRPLSDVIAEEQMRALDEPDRESSWRYAREIVLGVDEHAIEIDEAIESASRDWTIDRMPRIDRAILRIGVWELKYNAEVPVGVVINEAVESAKQYSTDDSARFVNGVLGRIAER